MIECCDCAITPKTKDNPMGICPACQRRALEVGRWLAPRRSLRRSLAPLVLKALPWILSANTIVTMWLAGSLNPQAWVWGLWGQVGWTWWICTTRTWGFLPMNLALWLVYARNHFNWSLG